MRTAKTLIRLGGCPGWSESSLGAHSLCWFCHVTARLVLPRFLSSCSFSPFSIVITSLREAEDGLCACRTIVCLFILHALIFVLFLFLLVWRVAAASDRDTLLTVLLPFLMILENGEINTTAKANLTGEENIFGPDPTDDRTNDLSHANLARPQGSTSVKFSTSTLKIVLDFLGVRESLEMRLNEI